MICPNADVDFSARGDLIARVLGRRFALVFGRAAITVPPRFFAFFAVAAPVDFAPVDFPAFPDFIFADRDAPDERDDTDERVDPDERDDRADLPAVRVAMARFSLLPATYPPAAPLSH